MATKHDIVQTLATEYASAWSSGDPAAVAGFFIADGQMSINQGDTSVGAQAIIDLVAGFYTEFPDLDVRCDLMRCAGQHAVFVWTLEGHHAQSNNHVVVGGWSDWELDDDMKVRKSSGWFDEADYQRQIDGR